MECPICFKEYVFLHLIDGCKHRICRSCLEVWSQNKSTCPFCRSDLKKKCVAVIRIWYEISRPGAIAYINNMTYDRQTEYVKIAFVEEKLESPDETSAPQIFYRHS